MSKTESSSPSAARPAAKLPISPSVAARSVPTSKVNAGSPEVNSAFPDKMTFSRSAASSELWLEGLGLTGVPRL